MHWESFKEKASNINKKWFFKKTFQGYEVWDIAQVYGPGYPRKYKIMALPFKTNSIGFSVSLNRLKQGEWNRRLAKQLKLIQKCLSSVDAAKASKDSKLEDMAREVARYLRPMARRIAEDSNISEKNIRLSMKGVAWDDTKKALRKIQEARGVYR